MDEPIGTTIFCDDIRFEQANKFSLMGIYGPELVLFAPFPTLLSKLGLYTTVSFKRPTKIDVVSFQIYFPGDEGDAPTFTQDLPWNLDSEKFPVPDPIQFPDPANFFSVQQHIILGHVTIKSSGYMRVRIRDKDRLIKAGSLKIRSPSEEETAKAREVGMVR